ncbi:hypothetical protein [Microtetraspora fusca]|uniref:hypothetical protein n=1 Tax=Microtetraspora fusca TaxID=1997 RepID=UPI000AFCFA8E|nr:hypothetical protein [Microtetraspora fusca]
MRIRPMLSAVVAGGLLCLCSPAQAAVPEVRRDTATDIVDYECTISGVAEKQEVKVKVELTMPTDATVDRQLSIGWHGTYADGSALKVPAAGLPGSTKLYAYAAISGLPQLSSATGVEQLATLSPGQIIQLPTTTVSLRTTPKNAGTASVRPGAINFGTETGQVSIKCEVRNADALKTYTLTVAAAGGQPSHSATPTPSPEPTPSATASASSLPTHTVTATVTQAPEEPEEEDDKPFKTPVGGAATGGGGESGPDGRMIMLIGSVVTLAAATGLLLRRRGLNRGLHRG